MIRFQMMRVSVIMVQSCILMTMILLIQVKITHNMESVTQGQPLDMVAYWIGIHPMIKRLKSTYPDVTQP